MKPATATYRALIQPIPPLPDISTIASQPPSTPCTYCAALTPDRHTAERGRIRTSYTRTVAYPSFPELKESARVGCGMCRLLRKAIRAQWSARPMEEAGVGVLNEKEGFWDDLLDREWDCEVEVSGVYFTLVPLVDAVGDPLQMGGLVTRLLFEIGPASLPLGEGGGDVYGKIGKSISFKIFDSIDLYSQNEDTRRRLPRFETLSDENLQLAKGWVENCKTNHAECAVTTSLSAWLPTRLLQISAGVDGPGSVCLLETATLDPGQKRAVNYIALSHMWGDLTVSPPFRTMRSNYAALTKDVDGRELPRNFVDAVRVCWRLGIRYLWIDSLCIIQDDLGDWEREAQLMHLVYKNAELTIVATSARSSHDGFLSRDTYMMPAVKLKYSGGDDSTRCMILTLEDDVETGLRSGDVDRSSWNTRGWTMQERSLSTRILHFCRNKLYFECRACLKSEEGEPESVQSISPFRMWPSNTNAPSRPIGVEEFYSRWRKAVVEYSSRNLTHGSDKLRAIQSLAAEMTNSLASLPKLSNAGLEVDNYIPFAGMWRQNLYRELLWYVERGTRVRPPAHDKRNVPSWSWASLDVRVGFIIGDRSPPERRSSHVEVGLGQEGGAATSGDRSSLLDWSEEENPFRILVLGTTDHGNGTAAVHHYISIETVSQRVSRITYAANEGGYSDQLDRLSFPYSLFTEGRDAGRPVVFAHATLDLDNKDSLLSDTKPLMYAHISNEQFPSGLLLQQKDEIKGSGWREVWSRVGVATVFYKTGEIVLDTLFEGREKASSIIIV